MLEAIKLVPPFLDTGRFGAKDGFSLEEACRWG